MNTSPAYEAGFYGDNTTVAVVDIGADATNPEISDNVVDVYNANPSETFTNTSNAHGTAVAELVVDTAPNSSLVLIEIGTEVELYNAMDYIRTNTTADVVVMSLSWYNVGPLNGSGAFNTEFEQSVANGTVWSVSAGNDADGNHWNGTWQDGDGDGWLNVTGSRELIAVDSSGSGAVWLQWDDWPKSDRNLNLSVYDSKGDFPDSPTAVSDSVQNTSYKGDPTEAVSFSSHATGTYYVAVKHENDGNTTASDLNVTLFSGDQQRLTPNTTAASVTNPTTDAVISVGAVDYRNNQVRSFSSRGPTIDGRLKPDVVAPDGVSTSVYDPFAGTSAAAPHTAGVVALLYDKNRSLTPAEVTSVLESTANDSAVSGTQPDNDVGYGLVDAGVAVGSVPYLDSTEPSITNASATDTTNGDGTVDGGETVRVAATATDDGSGIRNVTANASQFGVGTVSLTDRDGDSKYNASFEINASGAAENGTYSIPITAADVAGNTNTTRTNDIELAVSDRTSPSVTNATAVDLTDGDGNVSGPDEIAVGVTATDNESGVVSVTANASAFGAGTVPLTDGDGDDRYNATFTVNASASAANGSYSIPVTAIDETKNANTTRTKTLELAVTDRTVPNVSAFSVRVVETRRLDIQFDSNETLSTVEVTITDTDSGETVETLSTRDFETVTVSGSNDTTYTNRTTFEETGQYRVALTTAADASGNDGSGGRSTTIELVTRSATVAHVGGPAPTDSANLTAKVYLQQESHGLLQIQLRDASDSDFVNRSELSDLGVTQNTTLAVNATVANWTPRLLLGAGRNASWNVTAIDSNTTAINITATPVAIQYNESQLNGSDRPWNETARADVASGAVVELAVSDLGAVSSSRRNRLNGTVLTTDAQAFGIPRYNATSETLSIYVAAPHLTVGGSVNQGFFEATLPDSLLSSWGISDPTHLNISALGNTTTAASTEQVADGLRMSLPIHYSAGDVAITPDTTPPTVSDPTLTDAVDGDGTVADGDSIRLSTTVTDSVSGVASVRADVSVFGAGTVTLTDPDGDSEYTATATVDGDAVSSDGTYAVEITATDPVGNANTVTTNGLTVDVEDEVSGSGGSGGSAPGGGGGAAPSGQTPTETPTATTSDPPPTTESTRTATPRPTEEATGTPAATALPEPDRTATGTPPALTTTATASDTPRTTAPPASTGSSTPGLGVPTAIVALLTAMMIALRRF